jgi:hypothetical protein
VTWLLSMLDPMEEMLEATLLDWLLLDVVEA